MAQSVALYRKWRPLTFNEVIGQEHITEALLSQVKQNRVSHAYIFTGTRGTGKTTCAKILARAVCCEDPQNGEPCNKCASCRAILNDSTSDCSEIDAASNTGVDNIRTLREEALYTPTMLSRRIFIIDEVHMLSTSAFNALLKIMEEPPSHVLFILATTDIHKVPSTILSRCQRFDFRRVSVDSISNRLLYIAENEGYSLTADAAQAIARLGDGSVRDSISLYDRCMPYNGTVDEARVISSLGLPDSDTVSALFECVVSHDTAGALTKFLELYSGGKDIIAVFDSLLSLVRDIYVVKLTNKPEYLSANSPQKIKALAEKCDMALLEFYVGCLSDLLTRLTRTAARRADGEMCLLKMSLGSARETPAVVMTAPAQPINAKPSSAPVPQSAAPAPQAPLKSDPPPWDDAPPPFSDSDVPPAPIEPAAPPKAEAPKRTSVQSAPATALKTDFVKQVSSKVGPAVRTYIALSDISALGEKLKIESPDEALGFMSKEANLAVFKQVAAALGYSDVIVTKKAPPEKALSPLDAVLNNARSLGIKIEE